MGQWINFAELRAGISLEDVIVRYYGITTLKRDGNKLIGPCPVHNGDSPRAFHADLEKNVWHCFSQCQKGGNQLDFVAAKEGVGIREAALKLLAWCEGVPATPKAPAATQPKAAKVAPKVEPKPVVATPPKPEKAKEKAEEQESEGNTPLKVKLDLKADHPHLVEDRKLKPETIKLFEMGYCSRGIMRGTIAIPIHDEEGELVAYAGRRLKPSDIRDFGKYKFPKGFKKEIVLWNFHRAKKTTEGYLIVVEGFFSVMKLHELGFTNVVAVMGSYLSDEQARLLYDAKEVFLLFDGNEAGTIGATTALEKLAEHVTTRIIRLPKDAEPEDLSARALRWLLNGMRVLDLSEVLFSFREAPSIEKTVSQP